MSIAKEIAFDEGVSVETTPFIKVLCISIAEMWTFVLSQAPIS